MGRSFFNVILVTHAKWPSWSALGAEIYKPTFGNHQISLSWSNHDGSSFSHCSFVDFRNRIFEVCGRPRQVGVIFSTNPKLIVDLMMPERDGRRFLNVGFTFSLHCLAHCFLSVCFVLLFSVFRGFFSLFSSFQAKSNHAMSAIIHGQTLPSLLPIGIHIFTTSPSPAHFLIASSKMSGQNRNFWNDNLPSRLLLPVVCKKWHFLRASTKMDQKIVDFETTSHDFWKRSSLFAVKKWGNYRCFLSAATSH